MKRILTVAAVAAGIILIINAPAILSWIVMGLLNLIGAIVSLIESIIGTILSLIGAGLVSLIGAILTPIMPVLIVIGAWAGIFLFFYVVSGGWDADRYEKHKYDKYFEAQDRWNKRHRR